MADADSISVDGQTYEDVVVRESATRYLVEMPEQGTVLTFSKDDVSTDAVRIERGAERDALHRQWVQNNPHTQPKVPAVRTKTVAGGADSGSGRAEPIRITNIDSKHSSRRHASEREGPKSAIASKTYAEQYADLLGPSPSPAARTGAVKSESAPRAFRTTQPPRPNDFMIFREGGRSAAVAGNQGFGGGFGGGLGGGFGGGGFGGGLGGRGGGFGGGGLGGRGGGFGGGGFGGGFGGGAPVFTNISDLFSTIDDRLVGETPAVIGMQVSVSR